MHTLHIGANKRRDCGVAFRKAQRTFLREVKCQFAFKQRREHCRAIETLYLVVGMSSMYFFLVKVIIKAQEENTNEDNG